MDSLTDLQAKLDVYYKSLFDEGDLDDNFLRYQRRHSAHVLAEALVGRKSVKIIDIIKTDLAQTDVDFGKAAHKAQLFKSLSSCFGLVRVSSAWIAYIAQCDLRNLEGCKECLKQVERVNSELNDKLERLFKLEKQIVEGGGSIRRRRGGGGGCDDDDDYDDDDDDYDDDDDDDDY